MWIEIFAVALLSSYLTKTSNALSQAPLSSSAHQIGVFYEDEGQMNVHNLYKNFLTARGGSIAVLENVDIDELEKEAMVACSGFVESFIREFKHQLKLNLPTVSAANTYSDKAITETISKLQLSLSSAVAVHTAKNSETFRLYSGSLAFQAAAYRARSQLCAQFLAPIYRQLQDQANSQCVELFERRLALHKPTPLRTRQNLEQLAESTLAEHNLLSNNLVDAFRKMAVEAKEGLLATAHTSLKKSTQPSFNVNVLRAAFDCSSETRKLRTRFFSLVSDRMVQLILAGTVNPYLRDSALPPTHFNFNYLLDPRSLQTDFEMANLYDSNVGDRPRAEPLSLPGVAQLPFDPNAHPSPKSKDAPWYQLLTDFFTQDE